MAASVAAAVTTSVAVATAVPTAMLVATTMAAMLVVAIVMLTVATVMVVATNVDVLVAIIVMDMATRQKTRNTPVEQHRQRGRTCQRKYIRDLDKMLRQRIP